LLFSSSPLLQKTPANGEKRKFKNKKYDIFVFRLPTIAVV
jgi:hypothetical protein